MKKMIITLLVAGLAITRLLVVELVAQDDKIPATPGSAAEVLAEKPVATTIRTPKPEEVVRGVLSAIVVDPPMEADPAVAEPQSGELSVAIAKANSRRGATKEAVIDIAHIFKNLPEFRRAQDSMKKQTALSQQNFQTEVAALKIIEQQVAAAESGSDTDEMRAELAKRKVQLEIEMNRMTEQMKQSEARMYASGFKTIRKAIADYAKENDIHIVRRATIGRDVQGQLDSGDPKAVFQAMQEHVLYVADDGIDITDAVLDRLNAAAESGQQ